MDDWLNDKFDFDHDGKLSPMEHAMKDDFRNHILSDDDSVSTSSDDYGDEDTNTGSCGSGSREDAKRAEQAFQQYEAERKASEQASYIARIVGWLLLLVAGGLIDNADGITGFYVLGGIFFLAGIFFLVVAHKS